MVAQLDSSTSSNEDRSNAVPAYTGSPTNDSIIHKVFSLLHKTQKEVEAVRERVNEIKETVELMRTQSATVRTAKHANSESITPEMQECVEDAIEWVKKLIADEDADEPFKKDRLIKKATRRHPDLTSVLLSAGSKQFKTFRSLLEDDGWIASEGESQRRLFRVGEEAIKRCDEVENRFAREFPDN